MYLGLERCYDFVADRVPPVIAGWADRRRPKFRHQPLNGQAGRQRMVRAMTSAVIFECVVETGTFRGYTTEYLAQLTGVPVKTVEAIPRYHAYARARLRRHPLVETRLGDSRDFLRELAASGDAANTTLFYLDAHWQVDLPLAEELEIIIATWTSAAVIVDDFEVPGDAGYGFDDYGPGKRLTADYLGTGSQRWSRFYPTVPSAEETGGRRGCIVMASPSLTETLAELTELRPA